jgi:hypothetical protein
MEEVWGHHAHLSEMMDMTSTTHKAKQQVTDAQAHTNYKLSMVAET